MTHDFPKWIHHPKHESVLVPNAEAEAVQLAVWAAEDAPPATAPVAASGNALTGPTQAPAAIGPRRGGRPKGSRNKA